MASFNLSQIKFERLALALVATFLLADNVPHPTLGPSLVVLGLGQVQQLGQGLTAQLKTLATLGLASEAAPTASGQTR